MVLIFFCSNYFLIRYLDDYDPPKALKIKTSATSIAELRLWGIHSVLHIPGKYVCDYSLTQDDTWECVRKHRSFHHLCPTGY